MKALNVLKKAVVAGSLFLISTSVMALPITSLYSTGVDNNGDSSWITGLPYGHTTATYQTTFDLTGFDLSSVLIDLDVAVDNSLSDISINGASWPFFYVYKNIPE